MSSMGNIRNTVHALKPAMMMITVQIALAGVNIFYKLAANDGMSMRVLVAYRFMFASVTVFPLALSAQRKKQSKLTWTVLWQTFFCALFGGTMSQNLYAQSLVLTSATFATAMTNLIPAITFIMALFFGLEKLGFGTVAGKAKLGGTMIGIAGATLFTFYKGREISIWSIDIDLLHKSGRHVASSHQKSINQILGLLLALASCSSNAFSLILRAKMTKRYPCQYSSTTLISMMAAVQATVVALCMERDWNQWKLGWNIRLLTVVYSGAIGSGLMVTFIMWCIRTRGPLFVSIFNPLTLVLVAIFGSLLLKEKLHLGSVMAAVIIICGLYVVLWGKSKEMKSIAQLMPSKSSNETQPVDIIITSPTEISNSNIMGTEPNLLPTNNR